DLAAFGALVARSQAAAEGALHNQIPETVALVQQARALGATAASAFGAGFGGSVWALVDAAQADDFCRRWARDYGAAFPAASSRAEFFVTRSGPPASRLAQPTDP
ncbi:MAG TPA: hypothetical protein VJO52_02565, partial [Gemmatimonadaceae bacterium]|nr:hypothetical protein [Gemmatimonadaceae bacterium]